VAGFAWTLSRCHVLVQGAVAAGVSGSASVGAALPWLVMSDVQPLCPDGAETPEGVDHLRLRLPAAYRRQIVLDIRALQRACPDRGVVPTTARPGSGTVHRPCLNILLCKALHINTHHDSRSREVCAWVLEAGPGKHGVHANPFDPDFNTTFAVRTDFVPQRQVQLTVGPRRTYDNRTKQRIAFYVAD